MVRAEGTQTRGERAGGGLGTDELDEVTSIASETDRITVCQVLQFSRLLPLPTARATCMDGGGPAGPSSRAFCALSKQVEAGRSSVN